MLHHRPRRFGAVLKLLAVTALPIAANGSALDFTGTLPTPESVFQTSFTLASSSAVTFQTWAFGGGTNAGGQLVSAGGFDPLIALFSGPAATAAMYVDGSGNPLADADNLLNAPWSYVSNCPPAGTVAIGSDHDCGDDLMQVLLPEGVYTLVLTDASYIPNAVYDDGALSEGFTDLTAGIFQTCDPVSNACISTSGNYAVDITSESGFAPEPAAFSLMTAGVIALSCLKALKKRRLSPNRKGEQQ